MVKKTAKKKMTKTQKQRQCDRQFLENEMVDIPEFSKDQDHNKLFEVCDRLSELYITFRQRYVVMMPGQQPRIPKDADGNCKRLDSRAICLHLLRRHAVSVYAGEYASKFLCFDVDNGDQDTVRAIVDKLMELGFDGDSIAVSTSGGKGYHVDLFYKEPVFTYMSKSIYDKVCSDLNLDTHKIEFRPTKGQSIKLPLSIHYKTRNICWYLNKDTLEPVESYEPLLFIRQVDRETVNKIVTEKCGVDLTVKHGKDAAELVKKDREKKESERLKLEIEHNKWPMLTEPNTRNQTMMAIAVFERNAGIEKDELRDRFYEWIEMQPEEFITDDMKTVDYDIESIVRFVFSSKFHVRHEKTWKGITFWRRDGSIILGQKNKCQRKFLFLIMVFEKFYGQLRMSAKMISEFIGCSETHVAKYLVSDLSESGVVKKIKGKIKSVGGNLIQECNQYKINYDNPYTFIDCGIEKYLVNEMLTPENFDQMYYKMLAGLFTMDKLKKHLTQSEIKYIKDNIKENDNNE